MQTTDSLMVCTAIWRVTCGQAAVMESTSGIPKGHFWARSGQGWKRIILLFCLVLSWSLRMRSFGLWRILLPREEKSVETLVSVRKRVVRCSCLVKARISPRERMNYQISIKHALELIKSLLNETNVQDWTKSRDPNEAAMRFMMMESSSVARRKQGIR